MRPGAGSNRPIVCHAQDWNGDPLGRTHLMRRLAKDHRVLWVNSIGYRRPSVSKADAARALKKLKAFAVSRLREVEPNLFTLNPLAIPMHDKPAIQALNRRLLRWQIRSAMRKLGMADPIGWVANPTAAVVAGRLGESALVYQCADEYSAFTGVNAAALAAFEADIVKRADLVIVSAEPLRESKSRLNANTVLVRHGVDFEHFRKAIDPATIVPREVADLPKPVIGFFGLVADWVDVDLMAKIARRFPQGTLLIVGKVATDVSALEQEPNVRMIGRKPYEELPAYCKAFDVAILPFRLNTLTHNANPLKIREYLAAGLPVVSSPLPEVEAVGLCRIGRDDEGFIKEIEAALTDPGPKAERSDAIRHESWDARADEVRDHLDRVLAQSAGDGHRDRNG